MAVSSVSSSSSYGPYSRGRQLEAAVENLSSWYFEYDEPPKSGWHNERIHPLPEESSATEPLAEPAQLRATRASYPSRYHRSSNQDEEMKPPSLATQTSEGSETPSLRQLYHPPRSRNSSDQRSSWGTRATTAASTTSSTQNDLVVSGWTIRGSEKKVMYHIDVRANESQLQTYTIRRSYTDFKHLHNNLSDILEARKEHYLQRKAAAAAAAAARPSLPDLKPTFFNSSSGRSTGLASTSNQAETSLVDELHEAWFLSFQLPPLPNAGFLSYWKRHDRSHLQNRCEMFQEILRAANQHPDLRDCYAMQSFLSIAPCAIRERGSSYVSLCEYSVPRLDLEEETRERKKLARERRRNSSAHPATVRSE